MNLGKENVKSLREIFKAATLMAGTCGFATAGIFYNTQDPQIIFGAGPVAVSGLVFGLMLMTQAAFYLKRQGEPIFQRNAPK